MKTQGYSLITVNKFEPYNIVTVGGVKCTNCSEMVPPKQMEAHLKKHIFPKNSQDLKNNISQKAPTVPRKLNLDFLNSQNNNEDKQNQNIAIRSLLPQQLPKDEPQDRRKVFAVQSSNFQKMTGFPEILKNQLDCSESEETNYHEEFSMEKSLIQVTRSPQLEIQKQIKLSSVKYKGLPKKRIRMYQSKKLNLESHPYEDNCIENNKKEASGQTGQTNLQREYYNIQPLTQNKQKKATIFNNKLNSSQYDFKTQIKVAPCKEKINTSSASSGFYQTNTSSIFIGKNNSNMHADNHSIPEKDQRFQCQQCHGFYCKTCKSDIPPIYRPVPYKGYQNQREKQNIDFYTRHVYHNEKHHKLGQNCSDCTNLS